MARAHHDRRTPGDWLRGLFRQPPPGFYSRPAVYLSGDRMEIEHFCTVLFFQKNAVQTQLIKIFSQFSNIFSNSIDFFFKMLYNFYD